VEWQDFWRIQDKTVWTDPIFGKVKDCRKVRTGKWGSSGFWPVNFLISFEFLSVGNGPGTSHQRTFEKTVEPVIFIPLDSCLVARRSFAPIPTLWRSRAEKMAILPVSSRLYRHHGDHAGIIVMARA
jgi:hypothetical protein